MKKPSHLLVLLLVLASCVPAHSQVDNRENIGMNLWFHSDFNNSFAFTDIVRRARNWGTVANAANSTGVQVDALGWPRQDAAVFLHTSIDDNAQGQLVRGPAPLPAGTYRIVFTGRAGQINPSVGRIANQRYTRSSNTTRANWILESDDTRHDNVTMAFTGTRRTANAQSNTGLTNLRIFLPGFPDDGSETFTPAFRRIVRKFGIVRFMDWVDANKNPLRNFADRVTPEHASYNMVVNSDDLPDFNFTGPGMGVAIEHMVQLCNETDTDLWLNIPARATDDCVRRMLRLIRNGRGSFRGLEAQRRLYLEYGNEIWNSFAPQNGLLCFLRVSELTRSALQRERNRDERHPINFDGLFDGFAPAILTAANDTLNGEQQQVAAQMRHRFVAFRLKTISDIAREVFGESQMMTRIRPILASQFGDGQQTFSTGLRFLHEFCGRERTNTTPANPVARRVNEIVFGGGGAPYSFGDNTSRDVFFARFPHPDFAPSSRVDAVLARGYGIKYVAYEGGPSLGDAVTGAGTLDARTERRFNNDERMRQALVDAHNAWMRAGGDIFVYYVLTGDPTFEFARKDSDARTPKMQAIEDIKTTRFPRVTTGQTVPATFAAGSARHLLDEGNAILENGNLTLLRENSFVGRSQLFVPVRTENGRAANATIRIETDGVDRGESSFDVLFNGRSLGRITVAAGSARAFQSPGTTANVRLQAGLNVITLRAARGESAVGRIRVAARN
jgi:hypothetical protein